MSRKFRVCLRINIRKQAKVGSARLWMNIFSAGGKNEKNKMWIWDVSDFCKKNTKKYFSRSFQN